MRIELTNRFCRPLRTRNGTLARYQIAGISVDGSRAGLLGKQAAMGAFGLAFAVCCVGILTSSSRAEESSDRAVAAPTETEPPADKADQESAEKSQAWKLPEPKGAKRLSPEYDVWVDRKQGVVMVDGQISLREGMLEMFACIRNTKEHESIVSANTKAFLVHAALLTLGAESGTPVAFVPEYKPPTGTEIELTVTWRDEAGKEHTARAQDWVQNIKTKKAMEYPFVFAGSRFWTDPESGKQYYQAEGGDFVCVSNFSTAMLDIPVPSSATNEELMFQAFTERIPPLGAPVRLTFKPKLKDKPKSKDQPAKSESK